MRKCLKDAERLIAAWNERQAKRMPMLFSPTIGAAITAGYWFLWVRCPACRTTNAIDLRTLDRHRDAAVTSLIPALSCRSCRSNAPLSRTLADRYPAQVILWPLDVTNYLAAEAAVNAAVERFGRLDVVANVAGYGNLGPIEDTSIEDFRAQIDTNLFGPIYLSKAAIPIMRVQGSGHILNFSSVGGPDRLNRPSALFSREVRGRGLLGGNGDRVSAARRQGDHF
jgi:hypothetical protein